MNGGAVKWSERRAFLGALLICGVALALGGCQSAGNTVSRQTRSQASVYATQFLGADGSIYTRESTIQKAREAEAKAYWEGDGVAGAPLIVISISEQTASFYKGGKLVGVTPVSTGNADHPTPRGSFRIIQKDIDHLSNLYGSYVDGAGNVVVSNVDVTQDRMPPGAHFKGASMEYFMRIHNGVGMHSGFLPGFPDSHGCIRMPDHMAAVFFKNVSEGTPVRVVP